MIVDNFEYLSKLFDELIDKDDFYFVQIIQRKKDGVELRHILRALELLEVSISLPRKNF